MHGINVLVSYAIRQEEDLQGLAAIAGERAQIAVNNLEPELIKKIPSALEAYGIETGSIHLRRIPPEQAESTLPKLRDLFSTSSFTLHADKRTPDNAYYSWIGPLTELDREGIVVGFENGRKTGSWLKNPYDLPEHPLFKLVLDTGHLSNPEDDLSVIEKMESQLLGIHLTAEPQGPYSGFERVLPWMFKNPEKEYVLEYGRDYIPKMRHDKETIRDLFTSFVAFESTR